MRREPPPSNPVPLKLNERHRLVALATISGWTNREIAEELGFNENRISVIKSSPQFKLLIHELAKRRDEEGISSVVDRITRFKDRLSGEWDKSLDQIISARDGSIVGEDQLDAAKFLVRPAIETAFPRRTEANEEKTFKLIIEGADFTHLAKVIAEDEEDAEVVETAQPAPQEPQLIKAIMPEDLLEDEW